jgi:hypothetical protein
MDVIFTEGYRTGFYVLLAFVLTIIAIRQAVRFINKL